MQAPAKAQDKPRSRTRIFYLMFHLTERRDRMLEEILRPAGLNLVQWRVLQGVGWLKVRAMNEVADYLAMDRTALTRAVDKLVERGLVSRAEASHDRRLIEVSLTEAGQALTAELLSQTRELGERLLAGIPDESIEACEQMAETVLERLVGHRAGARRIIDLV